MNRQLVRALCSARAPKFTAWCLPRQLSTATATGPGSGLHKRRELEYPIEEGLGKFLTPEGLRTIAVDWQEGLLDRLNEEVKGTELQNQSVMQVLISTAAQKSASLAFMYASQAMNNSFFLDNLRPLAENEESHESKISPGLNQKIASDFGNLTHLKSTMSAAALGMSSNGWVWLVQDANGSLGVVPTFGPGTVLVRNRMHRSPFFSDAVGESFSGAGEPKLPSRNKPSPSVASPLSGSGIDRSPASPAGDKSRGTPVRSLYEGQSYTSGALANLQLSDFNKIGDILSPLFCISVNEHAWLSSGYGVWGKEEYLKRFWSVLNWEKVSATREYWLGSSVQR